MARTHIRFDKLAVVTDHAPTNAAFTALASPDASQPVRRAAVAQLAQDWEWLMIRYDHRDVPADTALMLARGFRHAAAAAARYSREEGLMTVAWEKMYSRADPRRHPCVVGELKEAVIDPNLKKDSVLAKRVAAVLNFHGLIWEPHLWAADANSACAAYNVLVHRALQKLPGGGVAARDLQQRIRERQVQILSR